MKKYLFINTINQDLPSFVIFSEEGDALAKSVFYNKIENLVAGMQSFLIKQKTLSKDIKGVMVISGPGSFTSSRAGIALANSFNFLFQIPVLGIKDGQDDLNSILKNKIKLLLKAKNNTVASTYYNREPNITIKRESI